MLAVAQDTWRMGKPVVSRPVRTGRMTTVWQYYGTCEVSVFQFLCISFMQKNRACYRIAVPMPFSASSDSESGRSLSLCSDCFKMSVISCFNASRSCCFAANAWGDQF